MLPRSSCETPTAEPEDAEEHTLHPLITQASFSS
jgi:hypothetical protein